MTSEVISTLGIRRGGKPEPSTARCRLYAVACMPLFGMALATIVISPFSEPRLAKPSVSATGINVTVDYISV